MIVYRLSKKTYIHDLSGRGAEINGGRWNSKGLPVIYTAASRALAVLEVAVHIPLGIIPSDYYMATIELEDENNITSIDITELPPNWNSNPIIKATQLIGDQFLRSANHLALQVPSATVTGDFNYLINPLHSAAKTVRIIETEPFELDVRLFKK
jgi:RES domain-containing protein